MTDHLEPSPHMTRVKEHDRILATFIGQAHIAGTGPEGMTCRRCRFWGVFKVENKCRVIKSPGHFALSNKKMGGGLKKAGCQYAIRHKSKRRFPHHAPACRFFEKNESAPVPQIEAAPK